VLEALSCGLPVLAYPVKGPKDIIIDGVCGLHADGPDAMARAATRLLTDPALAQRLRSGALERARDYRADSIVDRLLADVGLPVAVATVGRAPSPATFARCTA
jgi:glycosyltransferase involved in cell wall biosynthesis